MEKRQFGKTDMQVSVLGFGGAEIGHEGASADTVRTLLNEALDAGLNVIDTAECYVNSEELIGNAVSSRRKEYYLFTKCGHTGGYESTDWTKPGLLKSIERSLERLRVDYVDLVQLHSCSEETLREGECIEALETAREKGYTRYIGYSGDGVAAIYAIQCGRFDTLQTSVSIADQEAIDLTLPLALEKQLGVIAKRPVANAVWRTGTKPESEYVHTYWDRIQELQYDFLKGDTAQGVIKALQFTLSIPGVHTAIVGTKKPGRWTENARMLEQMKLTPEEFQKIRARWKEVAGEDWVGQT